MAITQTKSTAKVKGTKAPANAPIVYIPKRKINSTTVLQLYVMAGGRCEFQGCNRPLIKHHLTQQYGNFGEVAHIVAFSPQGPRGALGARPTNIHDLSNLMLLCADCHKEIDQNAPKF